MVLDHLLNDNSHIQRHWRKQKSRLHWALLSDNFCIQYNWWKHKSPWYEDHADFEIHLAAAHQIFTKRRVLILNFWSKLKLRARQGNSELPCLVQVWALQMCFTIFHQIEIFDQSWNWGLDTEILDALAWSKSGFYNRILHFVIEFEFLIEVEIEGGQGNSGHPCLVQVWALQWCFTIFHQHGIFDQSQNWGGTKEFWTALPGPSLGSTIVFYNFSSNSHFWLKLKLRGGEGNSRHPCLVQLWALQSRFWKT